MYFAPVRAKSDIAVTVAGIVKVLTGLAAG